MGTGRGWGGDQELLHPPSTVMGPQPGSGDTAPTASRYRPGQLSLWHIVNLTSSPCLFLPLIIGWVPGTQPPVSGYLSHLIDTNSGVLLSTGDAPPHHTPGGLLREPESENAHLLNHDHCRNSGCCQTSVLLGSLGTCPEPTLPPEPRTKRPSRWGSAGCEEQTVLGAWHAPAHPARAHHWPVWGFVQAASPLPAPHQPPCMMPPRPQREER